MSSVSAVSALDLKTKTSLSHYDTFPWFHLHSEHRLIIGDS